MQRFTLSIDDELAERFDAYLTEHGYANRSECFRDILRNHFTSEDVKDNPSAECVGVLSYAYNHHERQLAMRMTEYQHEHAGEVISTMHVHATHEECVESVVIRGRAEDVVTLSRRLSAEPGVRHGRLNLIPVTPDSEADPPFLFLSVTIRRSSRACSSRAPRTACSRPCRADSPSSPSGGTSGRQSPS